MGSSSTFITCLGILIIYDIVALGQTTFSVLGFVGLIVAMIPVVVVSSIQILGSGMSTEGAEKIFGIGTLLVILCKIDLPPPIPFDLGLGIGSDAISSVPIAELGGIPFLVITGVVIAGFVSGIMLMVGGD